MSNVDLGFSVECELWQVKSYHFPSKIGGKPAWLDLENIPSSSTLQCTTCKQPLTFLCQVYAPFEEDDRNFHRTIFIFICRNPTCCERNSSTNILSLRNALPRNNKYYSEDPPEEGENGDFNPEKWVKLCTLCGCIGDKLCSKCKNVAYCSKEHQVFDWKERHRRECESGRISSRVSMLLYPESEIVIESEELKEKTVDEKEELEKFNELEKQGKTGILAKDDIDKYVNCDDDEVFDEFKEKIAETNDQILRYDKGGQPLWIAKDPKPTTIPKCDYCGSERQYEFQIMPQMFTFLKDNELDIGIIAVYTCKKSCAEGDSYKREFVFKQDVSIHST